MKVTLPNGTTVEGTPEELQKLGYLPPPPQFNWDGSPVITCSAGDSNETISLPTGNEYYDKCNA